MKYSPSLSPLFDHVFQFTFGKLTDEEKNRDGTSIRGTIPKW
jgi:hypothetical protein